MTEQHYGTAPCGCSRPTDPSGEWVCREHECSCAVFRERFGGPKCTPWDAAQAIEQGLRAIAGWPHPSGEFSATCGGPLCKRVQVVDGPGYMVGMELHGEGCLKRTDDGFRRIGHREREGVYRVELPDDTERPPAPRTTCYFCNGPVVDSRCTRCEARQP